VRKPVGGRRSGTRALPPSSRFSSSITRAIFVPCRGVEDTGADLPFGAGEPGAVATIPVCRSNLCERRIRRAAAFDPSSPGAAPTLSSGIVLSLLIAVNFSPATVSFNENARPASSSRRQTGMFGLALISRTRPAARSSAASFSAAGRLRFFGATRQRSSRREAALKMASSVSGSSKGSSSESRSRLKRLSRRHYREPRTGDGPGAGPKSSPIIPSASFSPHFSNIECIGPPNQTKAVL